jgi:hypothetical protein
MDASVSDAPTPRVRGRGWLRALALFLIAISLVFLMARPSVLVGIPYVLMAVALPVRRWPAYTVGMFTAVLVLTGNRDGLWWVERGWALLVAGWFVALTLRWPSSRFLSRALGAVAGAAAVALPVVALREGGWGLLDWQVGERLRAGWATFLAAAQSRPQGEPLAPAVVEALYRMGEAQADLFPALAALGSLAGLGVAWWVYQRVAHDSDEGLLPLSEFRFNDHLVWVFVLGLSLTLFEGGDGLRRAGANAVVFMGALYAMRGAAVVSFFGGGQSPFGLFLLVLALILVPPVVLAGALVIGLCDTWLDMRGRARALMA